MSGFQIPGLGQAKPNETLPPLPADVVAAAAASAEVGEQPDASNQPAAVESQEGKGEGTNTTSTDNAVNETQDQDAMAIDRPESPPPLTHALEAAIGGLGEPTASQDQPAQPEAPSQQVAIESVELQNDQGDNPEWEIDSSPYESSSDSSSSDSSDDDSDDNERYEPLSVEETARLLMEAEGGSDDEGDRAGKGGTGTQMRTKNELPNEILPKPEVTITAEMKLEELGSIEHIVENIMLVKAITPGEYQVLDTGSVLCTEDRVVIGAVAETIGKVLQPMYTVYFNSEDEIKQLGLQIGTKVYYPADHASFVFTQPLKSLKGSDASNLHDEEVGDDEMEFSDDEKEAEYKRAIKQKKKDKWKSKNEGKPGAGGGSGSGTGQRHPLSQEVAADGGLNYDDDGPYKPLARPPGFGSGPVSTESYDPSARSGFQRGRRGGDIRGRGSRGRGSGRGGGGGGGGRGGFGQPRDGYSLPPQIQQQFPPQPQQQQSPPALPNFGFQFPGWPQPPAGQGQQHPIPPPPPPPGWTPQGQGQGQAPAAPFNNPAFIAALMSQMQTQGGQGSQPWGEKHDPPQQ